MRFPTTFRLFLAAALTVAALPASAQTVVPPEAGSPHFAPVVKHLESGGLWFSFTDLDGDGAALAGFGEKIMRVALKANAMSVSDKLTGSRLTDILGLDCVKALGMSTRRLGGGMYRNRALLYMPDGSRGLMKVLGEKPAAFGVAEFAPADAGFAWECQVNAGVLLDMAKALMLATEDKGKIRSMEQAMLSPMPLSDLNMGDYFRRMNPRILFTGKFDGTRTLRLPGAVGELPAMQMMVALDGVSYAGAHFALVVKKNPAVRITQQGDLTIVTAPDPLPAPLDFFTPAAIYDAMSGRVVFTTHLSLALEALKGGNRLSSNADFKAAMKDLPAEGNGLTYVHPAFMKGVVQHLTALAPLLPGVSGNEASAEILKLITGLLEVPAAPAGYVHCSVPEGLLFVSNSNYTHKHTALQILSAPFTLAMLGGGIAGGYSAVLSSARAKAEEAGKAGGPEPAVQANLRQISLAALAWFIDHPDAARVSSADLIEAELLFEPESVAGESYKDLTVERKGGTLSVKTKDGKAVEFKYSAAEE
jgi:hypothetical protein